MKTLTNDQTKHMIQWLEDSIAEAEESQFRPNIRGTSYADEMKGRAFAWRLVLEKTKNALKDN